MTVGFCLKIFNSLGSLEIKLKLFFKIDGIALSLGCRVLANIVGGSLFSQIRSVSIHFCYFRDYHFKFFFMEVAFYRYFTQDLTV